jgi:hypothetical protein
VKRRVAGEAPGHKSLGGLAAWLLLTAAVHAADKAEFAVRWDPSQGGPNTVDAVLTVLKESGGKPKTSVVQYFSVPQPSKLPDGFAAIVRERTLDGKIESTYKLRGPTQLPDSARECPLKSGSGKSEVDISVLGSGSLKRSFSYSCSAEGSVKSTLPRRFHAKPLGCSSDLLRVEASDTNVESWSFPAGRKVLEVSWKGHDKSSDLQSFLTRVVQPLVESGVKPLSESKTLLGSACSDP